MGFIRNFFGYCFDLSSGFLKKNHRIVIELDTKYSTPAQAANYVAQQLCEQGKSCIIKENGTVIEIDGENYTIQLSARAPIGGEPFSLKTAVLRKID